MKSSTWIWAALAAAVGVYWYEEQKAAASPAPTLPSTLTFLQTTTGAGQALARNLFQNGCQSVTLPASVALFQNAFASDPSGDIGAVVNGIYDPPTAAALSLVVDGRGMFSAPVPGACVS